MEDKQLEKLKRKIPYDNRKFKSYLKYEDKLRELLEDSKSIALSELYPFIDNLEDMELPSKYNNWQIRASVELYKWQGNQGAKSYSELNLSWSRDNDGVLSNTLMNELIPYVGTPRRKKNDN
ncbi:MAG: hypothetical protein HFJ48_01295 [Clostridia bacterium]|nr:hypothetical protein [Clostridia bacterium]